MIHHPVLLLAKLTLAAIFVAVLVALHSVLSPHQFTIAIVVAIVVFLGAVIALWVFGLRILRRGDSRLVRGLVLSDVADTEERAAAVEGRRSAWVGRRGIALSPLRPSGTAEIDGRRLSVVAEGEFIPARSAVSIVAVDGPRIVVRRAPASGD